MKGPSTELIHAGETDTSAPTPLTTPIYETTTFVFENAQEVVAYNEGRSTKHLYSRYTNPTVVAAEKKLAAIDRAESALLFSSGQGATTTIMLAHLKAGDEIVCGAAIYGGTLHLLEDVLARFRGDAAVRVARGAGPPESIIGEQDPDGLVRVADQPDAALRRHRARRRRLPRPRRAVGDRQHVRLPDQPAAARARDRSRDAESDEVLERPQRRHRRHGQRTRKGAGGPGREERAGRSAR